MGQRSSYRIRKDRERDNREMKFNGTMEEGQKLVRARETKNFQMLYEARNSSILTKIYRYCEVRYLHGMNRIKLSIPSWLRVRIFPSFLVEGGREVRYFLTLL
jgi:hypothetical protein